MDTSCEIFELRVLSGLHQGAALPLFGECWSIGASEEADLGLYDPGVHVRHAQLQRTGEHWSLQAQEGLCRTMRALPWRTSQTLFLEPSFHWVAFVSALLIPKAVGRKRQAIRPLNLAIR